MYYEVQIPTADEMRTMQIEAPNWRAAMSAGITRAAGAAPASLEGLFVELTGGEMTVMHPGSRCTVRIRQLDEHNVRQSQIVKAISDSSGTTETATPDSPRPTNVSVGRARPVGFKDKATGAFRAIGSTESAKMPMGDSGMSARVVADTVRPAASISSSVQIEDMAAAAKSAGNQMPEASVSETALEDVFLEIMTIFEPGYAMEDAIDFSIDLAKKYVPCEIGGLLFASDNADHLYFAQARGKGRKKLLKAEFSIREGIPAFSLKDGASIAVNPANDPRATSELGDKSGQTINSVCCAPVQSGPRAYGVLLLANREERTFFSQYDANILAYIGSQMGKYIQDQLDAAPLE